jgi:hypothetical protein
VLVVLFGRKKKRRKRRIESITNLISSEIVIFTKYCEVGQLDTERERKHVKFLAGIKLNP